MGLLIFAGIAALVFGLDVILKQGVEESLFPGEERKLFGGKMLLRKVYNKGAMLNLMAGRPDILKRISAALGAATLLYDTVLLRKPRRLVRKTGMMLFTGGAFSNIFDRLVRGRVIDYIGFRTRWPKVTEITYNLGDFAIFAGMMLVSLADFASLAGRKVCAVLWDGIHKTSMPDKK